MYIAISLMVWPLMLVMHPVIAAILTVMAMSLAWRIQWGNWWFK